MTSFEHNALRRGPSYHVKLAQIGMIFHRAIRWVKPDRHPHINDINAHYARDIGLSASDIAYHQHRLPSQHSFHPRG